MKRKINPPFYEIRGGSWFFDDPDYLAASARYWYDPSFRYIYVGLRLTRKL